MDPASSTGQAPYWSHGADAHRTRMYGGQRGSDKHPRVSAAADGGEAEERQGL